MCLLVRLIVKIQSKMGSDVEKVRSLVREGVFVHLKAGVAKVAVIVEETGPFGTRTRGEVSLRKNASH